MLNKPSPDCIKCGWVKVIPKNFEVMSVIDRYINSFLIMGSINFQAIESVLQIENIDVNNTNIQKILIYINNLLQQRNER